MKFITILLLIFKLCNSQVIVEDFVTDTCERYPTTVNSLEIHMVKGKYFVSTGKSDFKPEKCDSFNYWPAHIRNFDDFEAYKLADRNGEYFLHVSLKRNARDDCSNLQACNNSYIHTDDNTDMYLYDWMSTAHIDTRRECVKFQDDLKIDSVSCSEDNRHLCLAKCIPEWPNCVIKESNTYRYDVNSPGIVTSQVISSLECANLCQRNTDCIYWTRHYNNTCKLIPLPAIQPWLSEPVSTDYHERATRYCVPPSTCLNAPEVKNAKITHNDTSQVEYT